MTVLEKTNRNIRLDVSYDGSNYHGWQRQKGQKSIQETLEVAISKMTGENITLIGSGRTDAGVHAICQTANFLTCSNIPLKGFEKGLNSLLPPDIAVLSAKEVPSDFHARKSARSKTYRYRLVVSEKRLPLVQKRAWITRNNLDVESMRLAAGFLVGTHDFSSFMAAGSSVSTTVRKVNRIEIKSIPCSEYLPFTFEEIQIEIEANGFLRYMVRNMTTLLKEVGTGSIQPESVETILRACDRSLVPPTAPSSGLYLVKVKY